MLITPFKYTNCCWCSFSHLIFLFFICRYVSQSLQTVSVYWQESMALTEDLSHLP